MLKRRIVSMATVFVMLMLSMVSVPKSIVRAACGNGTDVNTNTAESLGYDRTAAIFSVHDDQALSSGLREKSDAVVAYEFLMFCPDNCCIHVSEAVCDSKINLLGASISRRAP